MIQTGRFTLKQVFKDYPWTTAIIFFSIFATVVLVTVNLFIWINDEKLEETLTHHYRLIDDYHSIVYLDELLTQVAHLYVLTGDPSYKAEYAKKLKEIEFAIHGVGIWGPQDENGVNGMAYSNHYLKEVEEKAFALYDQGNPSKALALLRSEKYLEGKVQYANRSLTVVKKKEKIISTALNNQHVMENTLFIVLFLTAFFYILSWIVFLFLVTRYSKDFQYRVDASLRNLSHDMRNPIASMITYSETLTSEIDGPLNNKQKESLKRIQSVGKRLLFVIQAILNFAKLQNKKMSVDFEKVDIGQVIQSLIEEMAFLAESKGVHLKGEISFKGLEIETDRAKIIQIIDNLISNAIKYTDKGEVVVRGKQSPHEVRIQVIDTGEGISKEHLLKIFKPFFRVSEQRKEGLGLGLAITKRFADLIGAVLTVESTLGKGSTFTITLPVKERE